MRLKGLGIGLVAVAIAVAIARNIAVAIGRKVIQEGGSRGMQGGFMRMWDQVPDDAPPKRFLAAVEGIRGDVARIRELVEAQTGSEAGGGN